MDTKTIYLTSDIHFGDEQIIRYIKRPFMDAFEMDEIILNNINHTVMQDDILYILGDFASDCVYGDRYANYVERINCKNVYLIRGNHDYAMTRSYQESMFKKVIDYTEIFYKDVIFCLSHYPFECWNEQPLGSIMCHGHIHSKGRYNEINQWHRIRKFDVGMDANHYRPVSLDYIYDYVTKPLEDIFN